MSNLGLIFLCIGLGMVFRRFSIMPADAYRVLNRFVIYVSLPAITLLSIHKMALGGAAVLPVLMPWIFFALGATFFTLLGFAMGWSRRIIGALILTGSLGNTSFIGFPMILALYGPPGLPIAVLTDQPGSFLVLGTLGILTASICSGGRPNPARLIRQILEFPPFLTMLAAILLRPVNFPQGLNDVLRQLAATLVPLALVSVGLQLDLDVRLLRRESRRLAIGLFFKLLAAPALLALLYIRLFRQSGLPLRVTVVEAAMAPMITASIVALEYGLDEELASLMVGAGIPISLVTVPLWKELLQKFS